MVGPLGAQTDAGSVRMPDATVLGLFGGDPEPRAPPDPLDPLVVDDPAGGRTQHLCDLPIAKAAVPAGQLNDVGGQPLLIVWPSEHAAGWTDAVQAPGRSAAPTVSTRFEHGRCRRGGARGLVVSPCSLSQDHLVQRQIRDCPPKTGVLRLQILHPLDLIAP